MAYTKTVWVNNSQPYINADNLNKIENQLEENTEIIDGIKIYSTSETFTGKHWVDGSKIYRKTIHYTSTNGLQTGSNSINHNISNIGIHRVVVEQEYIFSNINFLNYTNSTGFVCVSDITTTAITVQCGSGWNGIFKNAYITIEYTKTTD